jgi:hypothetical protein
MIRNRSEARFSEAMLCISIAVFVVCGMFAIHSNYMANKAKKAADLYPEFLGEIIDQCLIGHQPSCVSLQEKSFLHRNLELSHLDYQQRMRKYGVVAVFVPFLIMCCSILICWMMWGKLPLIYDVD